MLSILNKHELTVEILPEKKGYIKKHVEYEVYSSKFNSQVVRRYSDFLAFHEVLNWRFPNRLLPPIPPQKLSALVKRTDSDFAEERRKGLLRWLKILMVHPVIGIDPAMEYFLTRIVDDMSTSIRDHFKCLPDEFVTGQLVQPIVQENIVNPSNANFGKEQMEPFINSVSKIIGLMEKTSTFGQAKKEDMASLTKELKNMSSLQTNNSIFDGKNWAGSQENLMTCVSQMIKNGNLWKEFAQDNDKMVVEPLKILHLVLQGYKELNERCHSDKVLNMEFKKNVEKILNIRHRKLSGILASNEDIIATIEDRVGQLHVDGLEPRKLFAMNCLIQETYFALQFTGLNFAAFLRANQRALFT